MLVFLPDSTFRKGGRARLEDPGQGGTAAGKGNEAVWGTTEGNCLQNGVDDMKLWKGLLSLIAPWLQLIAVSDHLKLRPAEICIKYFHWNF